MTGVVGVNNQSFLSGLVSGEPVVVDVPGVSDFQFKPESVPVVVGTEKLGDSGAVVLGVERLGVVGFQLNPLSVPVLVVVVDGP